MNLDFTSKYVERDHAIELVKERIAQHSSAVVAPGENESYRIGKHLGYSDALTDVLQLLKTMPEAKKPDKPIPYNHYR